MGYCTSTRPILGRMPATMIPVGAKGESDPALAPLPIMMAIRKAEMPYRPATAMPIGAIKAAEVWPVLSRRGRR